MVSIFKKNVDASVLRSGHCGISRRTIVYDPASHPGQSAVHTHANRQALSGVIGGVAEQEDILRFQPSTRHPDQACIAASLDGFAQCGISCKVLKRFSTVITPGSPAHAVQEIGPGVVVNAPSESSARHPSPVPACTGPDVCQVRPQSSL